jgi:hypothetical protein
MPKAKQKAPKTEKLWMAWDHVDGGFFVNRHGTSKGQCRRNILKHSAFPDDLAPVAVRIMPEAEYQRLIAAAKRKDKET